MLGKELSSFLGSPTVGKETHEAAPDPLLSPFLHSTPLSDSNGNQQENSSKATVASDAKRYSSWFISYNIFIVHTDIYLRAFRSVLFL